MLERENKTIIIFNQPLKTTINKMRIFLIIALFFFSVRGFSQITVDNISLNVMEASIM